MRPPKEFPEGTARRLERLLKATGRPGERTRIQAVLMRAAFALTPVQIATATGLSVNSVRVLHSRYLREGEACLVGGPGRGGRRHGLLPVEQQQAFLARYEEDAAKGLVPSVAQIKHDYERLLGHTVSPASIYRMMERIGWRKVVPRPFHPKKKPDSEEAFKKNTRKSSARRNKGTGMRR
jgi:transposase